MAETPQQRFAGLATRELGGGLVIVEATTGRARRRGLARLEPIGPDRALHIPRCPAVHTVGMGFALDLIWQRRDGQVARVDRNVAPWRIRICTRAGSVIETEAGRADAFLAAAGLVDDEGGAGSDAR